jgi:hypothetical protein
MTINRALIPLSGLIAAYREQPTHQLGTLSQKAFSVAPLVSSASLASIFFHYPRQRNSERDHGSVQTSGGHFGFQ